MKYGQKIIEVPLADGALTIRTEAYFDGLISIKEQRREDIKTSYSSLLADVISCLDVLKTDTPELLIRITKDPTGTPIIIQKTWTVRREKIK